MPICPKALHQLKESLISGERLGRICEALDHEGAQASAQFVYGDETSEGLVPCITLSLLPVVRGEDEVAGS